MYHMTAVLLLAVYKRHTSGAMIEKRVRTVTHSSTVHFCFLNIKT